MKSISIFISAALLSFALALSPALAQEFPLTIEHKYGTTIIEEKPERVASLDYNGADNLLAFGVQPVTIRYWYGDYERAVWPWAGALLEGTPTILKGGLDFEAIAAADPDVIIAIWSGITDDEYEKLSAIAPTVAVPEGVGDYALPWNELAMIAGQATGNEAKAEELVQSVRDGLASIATLHPEWDGMTASVTTHWSGRTGVYTAEDIRPFLLSDLGLVTPAAVDEAAEEGQFWIELQEETLEIITADVVIWFTDTGEPDALEDIAVRPTLPFYAQGREVVADTLLASAFSHGSVISLPYALDRLASMIEAAIDGDPETAVPYGE